MNCKQGDLAIVVKCRDYMGTIVRCIRFVGIAPIKNADETVTDCWELDKEFMWINRSDKSPWMAIPYLPDSYLRPIRDSDKTDEIIERIGKPVKETT